MFNSSVLHSYVPGKVCLVRNVEATLGTVLVLGPASPWPLHITPLQLQPVLLGAEVGQQGSLTLAPKVLTADETLHQLVHGQGQGEVLLLLHGPSTLPLGEDVHPQSLDREGVLLLGVTGALVVRGPKARFLVI